MKALKYIFFLLLIIIIAAALYVAVQPSDYNVTRTRTIKAPAAVIFNNVNDYKNWATWNSWYKKNSDMKIMLPENTSGVGSSYSWEDENGIGTMTTVAVDPNKSIEQKMQINDYPKSDVSMKFNPNTDGSTDITWTISGKDLPFDFKMFAAFKGGMEKQIGPEYERSLELLDSIVQTDMKKYSITVDNEPTQRSGGYYIYNTTATTFDEFQNKMAKMYPEVIGFANKNNIAMAGAPFVLYHKWDQENNTVMFSCCVPTASRVITTNSEILTGKLNEFKALKATLTGNYNNLKEAYETADKVMIEREFQQDENASVLESYLNSPTNTPNPANLKTEIYFPLK